MAKRKSGSTDVAVIVGVEGGLDQTLEHTLPPQVSAFDERAAGINPNDLREIPRTSWFEGEEKRPTTQQLTAMRRQDGQARALYRLIVLPLRAALIGSEFVAEEDDKGEAEFINDVLMTPPENGGMTVTFSRFMAQLLQGIFDGFAAFEKVFWIPEEGPLKGKITLKKLAYRPSPTVTFLADEHGGFAGFKQETRDGAKEVIVYVPPPYAFYYAAQEEERKFYGVSYFESAFYHYDKKVRLYYTAHLAAQRAAVATRIGSYPANATTQQRREFNTQLSNLSLAQWLSAPEGFKVEALREGGTFDFLNYVNHHNNQMSKSILAGFFDKDTGAGKNDGAFVNFVTPGQDMFMLMLRAIQQEIADQINHYIVPQLVDLNFKDGTYPKFKWGELTDEQNEAIAHTFDKLATNPQNLTPQFVRALEEKIAEKMGLGIDYQEIPLQSSNFTGTFTPENAAQANGEIPIGEDGLPLDPEAAAASGEIMLDENPVDQLTADFEETLLGVKDGRVAATSTFDFSEYDDVIGLAMDFYNASDEMVALSADRVRTPEGMRRYGKPIGAPISEGDGDKGEGRPITLERLKSLQRQFEVAKKFGNVGMMRHIQREFRGAVTEFARGKSKKEIQDILNGMNSKRALQALNPLNTKTLSEKSVTET